MMSLKKFQEMKIQKTKFKLDHTSGTAGAEVKDLLTKKAAVADPTSKFDLMMDLKGDGVDYGLLF